MMKIIAACVASFLFFGWVIIAFGTFQIEFAVLGGFMGIIITLLGFLIYEIIDLKNEMRNQKDKSDKKEDK